MTAGAIFTVLMILDRQVKVLPLIVTAFPGTQVAGFEPPAFHAWPTKWCAESTTGRISVVMKVATMVERVPTLMVR